VVSEVITTDLLAGAAFSENTRADEEEMSLRHIREATQEKGIAGGR
jgi:hypothetical protein